MRFVLRYLFDITTSAHWVGPPVGITRVEIELARRAREHLGNDLTYCVYDRYRNRVLALDEESAEQAMVGALRLKFGHGRWPLLSNLRDSCRRIMLSDARVYHGIQVLRGRSFTRAQIQQIREKELAGLSSGNSSSQPTLKPLALDASWVMISCGLDWEFKDLRALLALKRERKFAYFTVVYDLIPIKFPHYASPPFARLLKDYFEQLCWVADRALCTSETTRRDWLDHCSNLGAPATPTDVFPLGSDASASRGAAAQMPPELVGKRYALFVSTLEPRKNHRVLYEAWDECVRRKLVDAGRDRLVFVGRRGWSVDDLLRELSINPATCNTVIILNEVDDAQLDLIYRNCQLVLFPSHYEGFGLPLAEALGHRKPCISSDSGALSELGGELVVRLGARDTAAWTSAISHYLQAEDELKAWSARISREYNPITWDKAAKIFFERIKQHAP